MHKCKCNSLFPIWVYVNAVFFKISFFLFSKALIDSSVSCHSYAKIWFQNSIIAIKLFLVMTLNMHLTSEILSQNDLKVSLILVAVLQRGYRMPTFHKLVWFSFFFFKWPQWSYKTTPFLPCQKQLHSRQLVSVHTSLHDNEFCSSPPLFHGRAKVISK